MIGRLLKILEAKQPSKTVANPYRNPAHTHNLAAYLEALSALPYSGHLLVGEALGYRGGALTGLPFSSPRLLQTHPHPFLKALRPTLIPAEGTAESTATIVWSHLQSCNSVPAFWNVFPFHPHQPGKAATNRSPNAAERDSGRRFLDRVIEILAPHTLISVGKVAGSALSRWFPDKEVAAVRHPSHGGKKAFIAGLIAAGICDRAL